VFDFNEAELIRRAKGSNSRGYLQAWACDEPNDWKSLLLSRGFEPSWDVLELVRPDFENIPDCPLPKGLEVKEVTRQDLRQVWDGMKTAYKKEPWYTDWKFDEVHYNQWIEDPSLAPELFKAAWDGDKIVGIVQNFIKEEENEAFGRRRGHTERIFVVPSWQRKGVAKALISCSLSMLRDMGMKDATLDVTAKNVSGALGLYMKLGYKQVHRFTFYRKPIPL
jgi:ribosomal protein S18 acetylase RimI-like enzyme